MHLLKLGNPSSLTYDYPLHTSVWHIGCAVILLKPRRTNDKSKIVKVVKSTTYCECFWLCVAPTALQILRKDPSVGNKVIYSPNCFMDQLHGAMQTILASPQLMCFLNSHAMKGICIKS